jgi:DNA primase
VDFRAVKEAAGFEPILARYGIELAPKGKELVGRCPFHEESRPSFRVNTEKRVFHCFGCGAKGNVLDFVARKEGISIKAAALLVGGWLGTTPAEKTPPGASQGPKNRSDSSQSPEAAREPAPEPKTVAPPATDKDVNRPLTFTLKLDPEHPYLVERGIDPEVAHVFGVGYCSRGLMKGRVAIPIHDADGNLIAYAGRWPGEPPEGEERYKLPPGFRKGQVLYNLNRVKGAEELILVEGYWSVMHLHNLGRQAVALMGRDLSPHQEELLAQSGARRLVLLLDGDAPGREAAQALLPRLAHRFSVRLAELPDGTQPDTVSSALLCGVLG